MSATAQLSRQARIQLSEQRWTRDMHARGAHHQTQMNRCKLSQSETSSGRTARRKTIWLCDTDRNQSTGVEVHTPETAAATAQ